MIPQSEVSQTTIVTIPYAIAIPFTLSLETTREQETPYLTSLKVYINKQNLTIKAEVLVSS